MGYKVVRGGEKVARRTLFRGGVEVAQHVCERSVECGSQTHRRMRLGQHLAVKITSTVPPRGALAMPAPGPQSPFKLTPLQLLRLRAGAAAAVAPTLRLPLCSDDSSTWKGSPMQRLGTGKTVRTARLSAMKRMTSIDVRLRWTRR